MTPTPYWAPDDFEQVNGFPRYPMSEMERRHRWVADTMSELEIDVVIVWAYRPARDVGPILQQLAEPGADVCLSRVKPPSAPPLEPRPGCRANRDDRRRPLRRGHPA